MLKKSTLFLFLLLFISSCKKEEKLILEEPVQPSAKSEEEAGEQEERKPLKMVKNTDTVKIIVRSDGAPGMYLSEDGTLKGFYVELEKMIMKEMNQTYEFIPYDDLGPVYQGIKTGIYHIALAVPDVPDYRQRVNLSIPYEILHYVTFVQDSNNEIHGSTRDEIIQSLYGKKVGVQTQGHIFQVLRDFKEIELIHYPTTTKALEALNQGLLDAVPDVKRIGLHYSRLKNWKIKAVGEPIISHRISTGFSQAIDTNLVDRYNTALNQIITDNRLQTLWESYYGPMGIRNKPWETP